MSAAVRASQKRADSVKDRMRCAAAGRRPGPHGLFVALFAAFLVCGCRGGDRPPPDALVVLLEAAPRSIDPRFATSDYDVKLSRLVFAGLVTNDTHDGRPELDLAESITPLDGRTYHVELRPDARFHDGEPVTTADVAYTFGTLADVGSPYASLFADLAVEVVDELTVILRLPTPQASFVGHLDHGIVPAHLLSDTGTFGDRPPIGAGPYRWAQQYADGSVLLRGWEGWHGGNVGVPAVVFRPVVDDNARMLSVLGGAAHLVQNATAPMMLPVFDRYDNLEVTTGPSLKYTYLAFNLDHPVLGDLRVRRAIARAIDRVEIVEHKFRGTARLSTGLLPPHHWAYHADVETWEYDPAAAERELEEAGYPVGADGCRFSLTFKTSANKFRRSIAELMAAQLGSVGICVHLRSFEWGTYFGDIKAGNFELTSLQWPSVLDPDLFRWIFHSANIPTPEDRSAGANRGRYRNPEIDRLTDAGRASIDPAERAEIYARVQEILAQDLPYVSLWHEDNIVVSHRGLQGYAAVPNARFRNLVSATWEPVTR